MPDSERLFVGETRLTPVTLARCLLAAGVLRKSDEWSEAVLLNGLVVDLSKVEWVDFGAAAQLALLIHKAAMFGLRVVVMMPDKRDDIGVAVEVDVDSVRLATERTVRRLRAFGFLSYLRFPEAILFQPNSSTWLRPSVLVNGHAFDSNTESHGGLRLYSDKLVPLTWINHDEPESHEKFTIFLSKVVGRAGIGLTAADAKALANVIVFELVENVFRHSGGSGLALVSAWARGPAIRLPVDDYYLEERRMLASDRDHEAGVVEIFVGDAGVGLSVKLKDAYLREGQSKTSIKRPTAKPTDIIDWAFTRWSSSGDVNIAERGVRGLYRVDRLTSRYRGLISVQSHRTLRYRSHFSSLEIFSPTKWYVYTPGTTLRLRLFVPMQPAASGAIYWTGVPSKLPRLNQSHIEVFNAGALTEGGMREDVRTNLNMKLGSQGAESTDAFYIFFGGGVFDKRRVEKALLYLTSIAAPHLVCVLGLPGTDDELSNSAQSVSQVARRLQQEQAVHPNAIDPVLIISDRGTTIWTGVTPLQACAYNTVLTNPGISGADLRALLMRENDASPSEWVELDRAVKEHASLLKDTSTEPFETSATSAGLQISLDLSSLAERVGDEVGQPINELAALVGAEATKKNRAAAEVPGIQRGPFLTPSLQTVSVWIDLAKYLSSEEMPMQAHQAVIALSIKVRLAGFSTNTVYAVLSDAGATRAHRDHFANCLGIEKVIDVEKQAIDEEVPASFSDAGPRVFVFADLLASTETVKRTIVYALRQGYVVVGVACILDTRHDGTKSIRVWGIDIKVQSLAHTPTEIAVDARELRVMSPMWEVESDSSPRRGQLKALRQSIARSDAFSRSHVSRPNGRHLTFLVQPSKLIAHPEVQMTLQTEVRQWLGQVADDPGTARPLEVVVWTPVEQRHDGEWTRRVEDVFRPALGECSATFVPLQKFESDEVTQFRAGSFGKTSVRGKHVVVFDWGAITGSTLMRLARRAVEEGCASVLSLTVLSQMPPDEEAFFASISEMSAEVADIQVDLITEPKYSVLRSRASFRWLDSCAFGHFPSSNCPICSQRSWLSAARPRTPYLEAFRLAEVERLAPKEMQAAIREINEHRVTNGAADLTLISGYRLKFFRANFSTLERLSLRDDLNEVTKAMALDRSKLDAAIAIVSILADEPGWLKRAPLHFRLMRETLSDICLKLVLNERLRTHTRYLAIRVLRKTSKQRYTSELVRIFESVRSIDLLGQTLLYGVFSLLQRGYHEQVELLTPLRRALSGCVEFLDGVNNREEMWPARAAVVDLLGECEYLLERIGTRTITQLEAYRRLRSMVGQGFYPHSPPYEKMLALVGDAPRAVIRKLGYDANAIATLDPDSLTAAGNWLRKCGELWQDCMAFLELKLMPLIQKILPVLEVREKTAGRFQIEIRKIKHIADHYGVAGYPKPLDLTQAIRVLSNCREAEDFNGADHLRAWEIVEEQLNWFHKMFFLPQGDSVLFKILSDTPADLMDSYRAGRQDAEIEASLEFVANFGDITLPKGMLVYCSKPVLAEFFKEVFRNIGKHNQHQFPSNEKMSYGAKANVEDGRVAITIANDGITLNPDRPGSRENRVHGLTLLRGDIERFGGKVTWGALPSNAPFGATFAVCLELNVWEG